jgi:hypothetical protein
MRRIVLRWVAVGLVAYAVGVVGWAISRADELRRFALAAGGLLAVVAISVAAAYRISRVALARHEWRARTDGTEADYGEPRR